MGIVVDSTAFIGAERAGSLVVELLAALQTEFGDQEIALSVISAYELLHGVWRASSPQIRAKREEFVEEILHRVPAWPVTLTVSRIAAQLDAEAKSQGLRIPVSDLLIGSTALELGFDVVTGDFRHFQRIPALGVHQFG